MFTVDRLHMGALNGFWRYCKSVCGRKKRALHRDDLFTFLLCVCVCVCLYQDPRFDPTIDQVTGYRTESLLCMPMCNYEGHVTGVAQIINKSNGETEFSARDEMVLFASYCPSSESKRLGNVFHVSKAMIKTSSRYLNLRITMDYGYENGRLSFAML